MDIPKTWKKTNLKDVVNYQKGKKPSVLQETEFVNSAPYLDIKALEKGEIRQYADLKSSVLLDKTSVAMVWDGARSGWVSKGKFGALGSTLAALQPVEIDVTYLYYFLKSQFEFINTNVRGIGIPHVDPDKIWTIQFPQAPIIEQKQISKKLDEIFSHLDLLNTRLDRIPELIKAFKEKVLTYAVTGKLTEEWRKQYKITEQWKTEKADTCCEKVQSGGTPKKGVGFSSSGYPFLKVYNIVNQKIDFDYRPQFIDVNAQKFSLRKSICLPGDVLMNIVGPPLCKIAIVSNQYPEWNINQAITLFRPKEYLSNKFLYYFFCEGSSVKAVMPETRGVVGQINISLSQCRDFSIPIPSIEEQNEIVRVVETFFLLSEQVERYYHNLKDLIVGLPEATLKKAFTGKLTKKFEE